MPLVKPNARFERYKGEGKSAVSVSQAYRLTFARRPTKVPDYGGFSRQVVDPGRERPGKGIHYSFGNVKPKAGIRRMRG